MRPPLGVGYDQLIMAHWSPPSCARQPLPDCALTAGVVAATQLCPATDCGARVYCGVAAVHRLRRNPLDASTAPDALSTSAKALCRGADNIMQDEKLFPAFSLTPPPSAAAITPTHTPRVGPVGVDVGDGSLLVWEDIATTLGQRGFWFPRLQGREWLE
ncbi:hypothetical protein GUJ93_ZPchr0009g1753 [Zizania palustris]|uniref:Uncharacterized protein n=1 Tax=Zizania palustris TaxID=103762 RepID=A0A8J5UYS2_ZIZPA|nr:hypothetical protein GUJ93_ZPchr0009g1753 [Zizania palustris]